jgi:DNA-binding transcriptional regulator YiaG
MTPEELRATLDRLGLTQLGAAKLLSVDGRTVRRWIAGDRDIPGPAIVLLGVLEKFPAALAWLTRRQS